MMRLSVPSVLVCVALTLTTACGPGKPSQAVRTAQLCEKHIGKGTYFLGTPTCFESLPMENLTGYWIRAHEYSVFYTDRKSISSGFDPNATWLELSEGADAALPPFDGEWRLYEVSFIGVTSRRKGVYGNGTFSRGAYVQRFLSLKELERR